MIGGDAHLLAEPLVRHEVPVLAVHGDKKARAQQRDLSAR